MPDPAKRYSNTKYIVSAIAVVYSLALILIILSSRFSWAVEYSLSRLNLPHYLLTAVFLLVLSVVYYLLNLPISYYAGYALEHEFNLSKQSIKDWWLDQLKSGALSYLILLILVLAFYWILGTFGDWWWLAVSLFWVFFSVILAKLTPVLIIPLFFKYKKLDDQFLRERIFKLARKMGVKLLDVFEIDFSKKTLKANAAFTGMGRTRRVILADTLKDKYSYDEIEVILAHEFAHYRLKHIIKLIAVNSLVTLGLFFLIFKTSGYALALFRLKSLAQLASLPLVFLYFMIFGAIMQPLEAFLSRHFEREADKLALEVTGAKGAFISMMEKLAGQNLADRNPHPIAKFLFFDHPPIDERIKMAK